MKINEIYLGDCLELMPKHVEDKSIDMIFCDLPYGTTQNKWDSVIDLPNLWSEYERVIKYNGAIVLFAAQPFTSALIMSNPKMFKYDWVWQKPKGTGHLNAKKQPMRDKEDVLVFYKKQCTYNPQMTEGKPYDGNARTGSKQQTSSYGKYKQDREVNTGFRYPKQVQKFGVVERGTLHPTEKPLEIVEYMIKTYTNEGDLILDNTCGSGTTGLGAKNLKRNYIMMEQDPKYYETACKRVLT
jgi:site-specific DNA-methyltransferase (adenine-specific)